MSSANQASLTHLVPAMKFLAWWNRMLELERELPEEMTDHHWRTVGQPIRILIVELMKIGEVAGAIRLVVEAGPSGSFALIHAPNSAFDWTNGQIDFQAQRYYWDDGIDRATSLIANLEKITGISERDDVPEQSE